MALRIGELAGRAGLSVRALRHYDALGLLVPSQRSVGGYRLYGRDDVMRLHAILALKAFGCSLPAIREALAPGAAALPEILSRQASALEEKAKGAKALAARITHMLSRMERHAVPDMSDWLEVLGLMHVFQNAFSPSELARLRQGPGRAGWRELAGRVEQAMAAGTAPDAPEGLALASEVRAMAREATGGDPALAAKLRSLLGQEARMREAAGFSARALDWLEAALAASRKVSGPTGPTDTALGVAKLRAAHQLLDDPPVFVDPLALAMVGPGREAAIRNDPARFDAGPLRGLRASVAVRSRLAEDAWEAARARGVRQYVILGAGYDTFACRTDDRESRIFEVDHPATQAQKCARLAGAGLVAPDNCVFVPLDFTASSLAAALYAAGFRREEPAFFSWLGVTMYLPEATVCETLEEVAAMARGTEIVFDYSVSPRLLSPGERRGREAVVARAAAKGEPWLSDFDPAALAAKLAAMGFARIRDWSGPELNARYLAGRRDDLRKSGVTRIAAAAI